MSKFNNTHALTAAAFGAAALFSMLSFCSNAEAANILSCKGATASTVASCCEKLVEEKGRPLWMMQAKMNCHDVTCRGRECYYKIAYSERFGGNENHESRDRK